MGNFPTHPTADPVTAYQQDIAAFQQFQAELKGECSIRRNIVAKNHRDVRMWRTCVHAHPFHGIEHIRPCRLHILCNPLIRVCAERRADIRPLFAPVI